MNVEGILKIGASIGTPLALIGLVFVGVFLLLQQLIKQGKGPVNSITFVDRILIFGFFVMVLGLIAGYLARDQELSYKGVVRDSVTNKPVSFAIVAIEGDSALYPKETDSNGAFAINGTIKGSSIAAVVVVQKVGYQEVRLTRTIRVDSKDTDTIRLVPIVDQPPIASQNPPHAAASAASKPPDYETKWERASENGQPYSQSFSVKTENRHGQSNIIAQGVFSLSVADAKIYSVQYSCSGYPCGWSYNPNGGYGPSILINTDGHSFTWYRKWDGDPAMETYTALYEVPKKICIANCPP